MVDSHEKKYGAFLEGLRIYMERLGTPARPEPANDNQKSFEPLLEYRNGPPSAWLGTNWSLTSAGTVVFDGEEADYHAETLHEVTPSEEAIMRGLAGVEFRAVKHAKYGGGGETDLVPVGGDIQYGKYEDDNGKKHRVVVRLGRWKFSDGTQTERVRKRRPGSKTKTIESSVKLPVGAMRETRERNGAIRGGDGSNQGSKGYFEDILGAKYNYTPGGKRSGGRSYSAEESREMLDQAKIRTMEMHGKLPEVTRCPPGIASGGNHDVADLFIGMRKTTCAGGGAMPWQDMGAALDDRKAWFAWVAAMMPDDKATFDRALTASSFADLAQSNNERTARRRGKRLLHAANDNARQIKIEKCA